jgi:HD-like signal output (HDOD) protein
MSDEVQPKRVLIAQQDAADREFVRTFLEVVGGYEVIEALSGVDLIRKLRLQPHLILLDTQMKGDVLRALELMARAPALEHTAIAVLSYEQTKIRLCLEKGADGFIVKPFSPDALLAKIWKVLGTEQPEATAEVAFTRNFKKQLSKIENLPTLPSVYAEVDRICQNPDVAAEELSRAIEADPPITLKLLKLANSAFFGFTRRIKTVKDAVSLLGNQAVRNAILNIAIYEATKGLNASAGLNKKLFWAHSAGVGSIARFLNQRLKLSREDSFTAGIIHDMGKIILDALYSDYYGEVLRVVSQRGLSVRDAEAQVLGLDHGSIGLELAAHWRLPDELLDAISHHHAPSRAERDTQIASLIHVSDALCRRYRVGSGGDDVVPDIDPKALERLGLTPENLAEWQTEILETVTRDKAIMAVLN